MPDADLSTSEKAEAALDALGDQGGFSTLLETEDASFGQNELMEMALLGMEFADFVGDDESAGRELEVEAAWTPSQACSELQTALAKGGFTCPIVECSSDGKAFKNIVRGDCEGRKKDGDRFAVTGESVFEGTFDDAGGDMDARVSYKGFQIAGEHTFTGSPTMSGKTPIKSITLKNSISAEGQVRWRAQGLSEGSLNFSGEVYGRLTVGIGLAYEADGKSGGGDVTLQVSMGQSVGSIPERFTFSAHYSQECESKVTNGTSFKGAVVNQSSGSVTRGGSTLTLNATGRHGDAGMESCVESPGKELAKLMEEAYGAEASTLARTPVRRLPTLPGVRRSHDEDDPPSFEGKFSFKAEGVVADQGSCDKEPMSGTLMLTTPSQSVDVAFDGGSKCDGSADLRINGKNSGEVRTGDFLPLHSTDD